MSSLSFIGPFSDTIPRSSDNELVPTTLRPSSRLRYVNWTRIISKEFPLATDHKIDSIMHIGGQFAINPILLITKLLIDDQKNLRYLTQSDKNFSMGLKSFANLLSKHDQDFYLEKNVDRSSSLEYALRQMYNSVHHITNFIQSCKYIMKKYGLPETTKLDMNTRQEDAEIILDLPYPSSECWATSATHFGATQNDIDGNYVMSAIDFAPSLFGNWGVKFDYLNSEGSVHTSHSGRIKWHSTCSVEVEDLASSYSTYYSHIVLAENITENVMVLRGQLIGWINLHPDGANCNCDWANNEYECASGPHAHWELRKNGHPTSLNNRMISKYRITVGTYPHDKLCSDPDSCEFAKRNGSSCATLFTDTTTGTIYCPTVKGQNLGKKEYNLNLGYERESYARIFTPLSINHLHF